MEKRIQPSPLCVDSEQIHTKQAVKEKISQLIDGALPHDEMLVLLEQIKQDPELRQYWRALHTMRAVIQAEQEIDNPVELSLDEPYKDKTEVILRKSSDVVEQRYCTPKKDKHG